MVCSVFCARAVSGASHGDAVYLAPSNASLRPHHPGEVDPLSEHQAVQPIFLGGGWWFPNVLTLSTGFQEFHVCDLEKILYSYNPNSEWKLDKKGWVWAKRSLMINYLWAAKNIFKIGRPPTFTLQQAIISSQDLWFFYPPQNSQTNNSSCWLSTCVLQGAPPTSYTCIVITAIK